MTNVSLTPYLSAHPEYLDKLIQMGSDPRLVLDAEYASLSILDGSRVLFSSGEVLLYNLFQTIPDKLLYHRSLKRQLKYQLSYTRIHRGTVHRRRIWLNPLPERTVGKTGRREIVFDQKRLGYPSAIRKVRGSVRREHINPKRAAADPHKKRVRPSPETRSKSFKHVIEIMFTDGSYSLNENASVHVHPLYERIWTGVRTPNYAKLRKSQLPVNPHTVSLREVNANTFYRLTDGRQTPGRKDFNLELCAFSLKYAPPAGPVHSPRPLNHAIKRLIDKAGVGIDANLAQDLSQIGQIVRMLGTNTQRIVNSVKALKKGNIPGAVSALVAGRTRASRNLGKPSVKKDLAENWLELQYGWKPLLMDIHGVFKALDLFNETPEPFVQQVTASAHRSTASATFFNNLADSAAPKGVHLINATTRARIQIRFVVESPMKAFLQQTGFTNPVNLAWEILPFSFVADWFLPIGPFLEALSAWDGLKFLDGCQTLFTRQRADSSVNSAQVLSTNSELFATHRAQYQREWILLNRTKLTTFPSSTVPTFRNGFAGDPGVNRAANGIALIQSIFGKR